MSPIMRQVRYCCFEPSWDIDMSKITHITSFLLPNKRAYVLILGACAIVSSVFAIYSCQFFSYKSVDGELWEGFEPPFSSLAEASVGIFSYSEEMTSKENFYFGDSCIAYPNWQDVSQNILFYVAQWCSMVAPAAGFLAWFQIFFEMIYCRLRGGSFLISFLFLCAAGLQGCTFMMFADANFCFDTESVNKCTLKTGAWYSLGSTGAYLILGLLTCALPKYPGEKSRWGCCMITRGVTAGQGAKGQDEFGETSSDDDDDDDDCEKATYVSHQIGEGDKWSYEPTSVNWAKIGLRDEIENSDSMISDVCLNHSAEQMSMLTHGTKEKIFHAGEDEIKVKHNFGMGAVSPTKAGAVVSSKKTHQTEGVFDHLCCGDPLGLDEYMTVPPNGRKNKFKSKATPFIY